MGFLEHLHSNVYKPRVTLTSNGGTQRESKEREEEKVRGEKGERVTGVEGQRTEGQRRGHRLKGASLSQPT